MRMTRPACGVLFALGLVLPALGETYKSTYPVACSEVWPAVKTTLGDAAHYNVKHIDDANMKADYQPKHQIHVTITETLLQRTNHVTLIPKGETCEMRVVSNYSGVEHNDRQDFKQRVDDALAAQKNAAPEEINAAEQSNAPPTPAKSEEPAK